MIIIQAQHNTMSLFARDRFTLTSNEDEIVISTPEMLTLNGGGSYLKLSRSGIEHGSQGDILMKVATYLVTGMGASMKGESPDFQKSDVSVPSPGFQNSDDSVDEKNTGKWASN
ncbi:DUF2345 domain-containing protein [Cronobacter malonaticus]|uniref:DUF2345 domain-containing protein n=2 Tax=Cronobacter malonaticus TaxID=413503 RepID=UPI001E5D18D4